MTTNVVPDTTAALDALDDPDALDTLFAALADPTRRAILTRLRTSDATVAELTQPLPMSQPSVSKHLRVLEKSELISRSQRGTSRLSHLESDSLRAAAQWVLGQLTTWSIDRDQLDDILSALQDDPLDDQPTGRHHRT